MSASIALPQAKPAGRGRRLWLTLREMASRPSGAIGLLLVLLHLFIAVASPWLVPFDFKAISASLILNPPDAIHWWGTDHLGRDVLTRTLLGGREAILVTLVATPLAVLWGGFVGIYLGLAGGRLDDVLMRVVDAFLALPWILKMLLLIATFGSGIEVLIPTLAVFYGIPVIRIARARLHCEPALSAALCVGLVRRKGAEQPIDGEVRLGVIHVLQQIRFEAPQLSKM